MGLVERGNSRFETTGKHARKGLEREEESWYRGGKRGGNDVRGREKGRKREIEIEHKYISHF